MLYCDSSESLTHAGLVHFASSSTAADILSTAIQSAVVSCTHTDHSHWRNSDVLGGKSDSAATNSESKLFVS